MILIQSRMAENLKKVRRVYFRAGLRSISKLRNIFAVLIVFGMKSFGFAGCLSV